MCDHIVVGVGAYANAFAEAHVFSGGNQIDVPQKFSTQGYPLLSLQQVEHGHARGCTDCHSCYASCMDCHSSHAISALSLVDSTYFAAICCSKYVFACPQYIACCTATNYHVCWMG